MWFTEKRMHGLRAVVIRGEEMSETENKNMKSLKVEVKVEHLFHVRIHGELIGTFTEKDEMCGMKLLHEVGCEHQLVLDFPTNFEKVMSALVKGDGAPFEATVMKVAPPIADRMKEAIDANTKAPEPEAGKENENAGTGSKG